MSPRLGVLLLGVVWPLAGCGAQDDGQPSGATEDAGPAVTIEQVTQMLEALPSVTRVAAVPSRRTPGPMLGLEDLTYLGGAVAYDRGLKCRGVTVECGVEVEVWASAGEASARSRFVKALEMGMMNLGAERHFLNGPVLLRVSDRLSDKRAQRYASALGAESATSA